MPRFSTPRKTRSSRATAASAGKPTVTKGLYERTNGAWYCDCTPRERADIRSVTKDGWNKNRRFWTCPKDRRAQCGFFLWDEDARAAEAEAAAAAAATATTPSSTQRFRQMRITATPLRPPTTTATTATNTTPPETPSRPRRRPALIDDVESSSSTDAQIARDEAARPRKRRRDDDRFSDGFDDADSDLERELAALADRATPATPAKPPSTAAAAGLPTPAASRGPTKRVRLSTRGGLVATPTTTPTPPPQATREEDQDSDDCDLTREVLALLDRHLLLPSSLSSSSASPAVRDPVALRSALRDRLDAEALRMSGVRMSRDALRERLSSRDARISELQDRVAALENERTVHRRQIAQYQAKLEGLKRVLVEE